MTLTSFARLAAFAFFAISAAFFAQPAHAGSSDNVTGWAWSGNIGWISLNCTNTGECATADYGVHLSSSAAPAGTANLTGFAWSERLGWMCFGTSCSGVTPEGGASYAQYRSSHSGKTDQVWGWAQVLSMGTDGWISLNCDRDSGPTDCTASDYHIVLDPATGNFTKGAPSDHWAWGMNDEGPGVGWVDFSLAQTSWVSASLGPIFRPEGIFEPDNAGLPGTHISSFAITFDSLSAGLDQRIECDILLPDSSQIVVGKSMPAPIVDGTTTLTYTIQPGDYVERNKLWYITGCRLTDVPLAQACGADTDCSALEICDESISRCRSILATSDKRKPIFTHENVWTGLDAAEDQYRAIKCNAGFPDNYFKNAAQCDFTGDASFSLSMRRGIPVEGICDDGIDNDGNSQIDCADRYCQGISFRCQTLPRSSCVWNDPFDGLVDCSDAAYSFGDLCCTQQPRSPGASQHHVVNGLECTYDDPNDGYFDCDCVGAAIGSRPGCFVPGHQTGDLCCSALSEVEKL